MFKSKGLIVSLILLVLGAGCIIAFAVIGSSVDENGLLREQFALLPIGYALLFLGIVMGIISSMRHVRKRIKGLDDKKE